MSKSDHQDDPDQDALEADLPERDAPPTEAEVAQAEVLRLALEGGIGGMAGRERGERAAIRAERDLVNTVRAAASSAEISVDRNQRLVERALGVRAVKAEPPPVPTPADDAKARRGNPRLLGAQAGVVPLRRAKNRGALFATGGAVTFLAMAAAVAIALRPSDPSSELAIESQNTPIAYSRSTAALFPDGLARSGGTTSRVDRIAYARAQDLRQNQFARWGVR